MEVSVPVEIPSHHRILFKPVDNCETDGCHMEVWLPDGVDDASKGRIPIAIMLHGGGWVLGACRDIPYNQVQYYLDHNIAVVTLEYRLLPQVIYTDILQDLLDAYIFIQQQLNDKLAEERNTGHAIVDIERCIAFGAGAGATSCLYLVADIESHNKNPSSSSPTLPQLKALICAYPLTNPDYHPAQPRAVWAEKVAKMFPDDWELLKDYPAKGKVCTSYAFPIGRFDTRRDPRLLFAKSATATQTLNSFLYRCDPPYPPSASALNLIIPTFPPTYILAAQADERIPVEDSCLLYDKLQEYEVESYITQVKGAEHGFVERPKADWPEGVDYWKDVINDSVDWAIGKVQ